MIAHALTILQKELEAHLSNVFNSANGPQVALGNIADGLEGQGGNGGIPRNRLVLSMVNLREEKTLKNLPNYVRNDVTLKAAYENPPVFLNLFLLVTAVHGDYTGALVSLSRAISFFQYRRVFTQDDVAPDSLTIQPPLTAQDQLESFKLILDLYSASMEEVNHLWGTLGGKQYPFVIYILRMLELKFKAVQRESGLITEIYSEYYHKNPTS